MGSERRGVVDVLLLLLFIIPTFYKNDDRYADATDPQIFRASITSDVTGDICELIQDQPK
ncbi:unnamed protein product [Anisakis simplex]|uniref:MEG10 n=1 Tax=Anisakis simplex TaxID=6269 RepID=A0A0M3JL00_ANISI|nr:unnamed protein product [Anisakis simplex]